MTASDTRPTSLRQRHVEQIQTLLSPRPSLLAVAQDSADAWLQVHFGEHRYNAARIYLATDRGPYRSLPELLLERLAAARPTLLEEGVHQVVQRVRETYEPAGPGLAELEVLINRCGTRLLDFYSRRLQAWWSESLPVNMTRWGYVSDQLLAMFYDSPAPAGMGQARFAEIFPKTQLHARRPTREWSAQSQTLNVQTLHLRQGESVHTLPLLLFTPRGGQPLLFSPASGLHLLDNPDQVQVLLPAYTSPLLGEAGGQWFALPVQGDPFDALAASYLERQLLEIAHINTRLPRTARDYLTMLDIITDTRRWFVPSLTTRQQRLFEQLPLWLAQAPQEDAVLCAQLLQASVLARQHSGSQDFLEGIPTLQSYADERLRTCLGKHPQAGKFTPGDIRLTFSRVIAAAVPVPGGFVAGEVQTLDVSLTELVLERLGGFNATLKAITLNGNAAPAWLTYEWLEACVNEVDIGQHYPALLKKQLLEDAEQAATRRRLFSDQVRIQLPMLALEAHLKGEHGLTHTGVRRIHAALQTGVAQRQVDGQTMALWPLAFKASVEAGADEVANMFIIGPADGEAGPHVLYRPLYTPVLQQYASLPDLLDAVARPGPLHDSVLTWLEPRRQAVYANGGFRVPHIRHFLAGDEFATYEKPAPASLSKRVVATDPAAQLFTAMAQSLVTLADRQTLSTTEQRWAGFKQLGWLLFGIVQPLLSGPLMLAAWLVQMVDSAQQDIAGLHGTDPQARNAALVDLLANLMVVIAHQAAPHDAQHALELEHAAFGSLAAVEPAPLPPVRIPPPAQFTAPAGWANARNALTPELAGRLRALSVKTLAEPWPALLPGAETSGPWQGLLRSGTQWQALVRGQQFRVRVEQGGVRVISADGSRPGPWLKHLGQGRWDLDLKLGLYGGGDDRAAQATAEQRPQLEQQYQQARRDRARAQTSLEVARSLVNGPEGVVDERQRSQLKSRYFKALTEKLQFCQDELRLLRQLRELAPRPRYEEELSEVLESIVLATQLLDAMVRMQLQEGNARLRPLLDALQTDPQASSHTALNQGMRELASIHDSAIRWRVLEQRYLDELRVVPRVGRDKAQALANVMPARPSVADLQSLQLTTLWGIAVDVPGPLLEDDFYANMTATIDRARWASRAFADLPQLSASSAERVELLDSIDHVFAQTDDRIEFWRAMEPDKFDLDYLQQLQELLATLHQQVQTQLESLLQSDASQSSMAKAPAVAGGSGKIIRTRNRDLLVARLSPEPTTVQTVQVHDAEGGVIGTFTEADDGIWDQRINPAPLRPDSELGALLKKAGVLLRDVDKAIAKVEGMVERANDPASLQELLQAEARSRTWAADAIARKLRESGGTRLVAVQQANARAAETRLRAAVAKLEQAGLTARIRATRLRPISQEDVAFLHSQGEVRIVRQGPRVALKGRRDDYLQVYAVNDVHSAKPVCFAHFHYARPGGTDDHFTAAHLKSPEQERLGRQAQAQAEALAFAQMRSGQGGRAVQSLQIRRSEIGLTLARRLFFSVD